VRERERLRVQRRAIEEQPTRRVVQPGLLSVVGIDGERRAGPRQVDADLMRAAGLGHRLDERQRRERRPGRERLDEPHHRGGRLAARIPWRDRLHAPLARRRDGRFVPRLGGRRAAHDRQVALRDRAALEGEVRRPVSRGAPREEEHAARAAVEPVHDPEPAERLLPLFLQGALGRAAPRDDDPAGRLRDGEEVLVLEEDAERHGSAHQALRACEGISSQALKAPAAPG